MLSLFSRFVQPFADSADHEPSAGVWRFIVTNLRPFRWVLLASIVFAGSTAGLEIWLIGYGGTLVDLLAATPPGKLWARHGLEFALVALVILLLRPLSGLIRESLDDIAFRPAASVMISWRAHRHVSRQSVGWFQNDLAGRIANRVWQAGGAATGAAYSVVHTVAYVAIYVAGSVWLLASVDPLLVLPLVIWAAAYAGLMAYAVPRIEKASEAYQEAYSAQTGFLVDTYANIATVKLYADTAGRDAEDRGVFERIYRAFIAIQRFEVTINAGMLALGSLLIVGLVGYAVVLWQAGAAPIGLVAAALALAFRITAMAEWLMDAMSGLFAMLGALRESLKTIAQPVDIADAPDAVPLAVTRGAIAIRDLHHHYGKGAGGLAGVSLDIAGGEKVALVGRSGAGKSTLVNLLLRFHQAEAGQIAIDGQDIRSVTQDSLRAAIAMVAQDSPLLHRSVRDNIAFGRSGIDDERLADAVRKAHADAFIPGLVDQEGRTGLAAHVGERGVKLSGGQRQRIALARAILKDAPILVLDEATSALDSEVEAAIQDTLQAVMAGKTVIAIAHRLSTIAHMDRIVVLDAGRIAEEGRHEALLVAGGIYARLWARQSGGFLGTDTSP